MDKATIRRNFEDAWLEWTSTLEHVDESRTREAGVCGEWNVHDVVGHVHVGMRYYLSQVRGAFDHVEATDEEINGEREPMPADTPDDGQARNVALQKTNAPLTWRQLLDEATWLRERALAFIDARSQQELNEDVGWLPFWDPNVDKPDDLKIHVRRMSEAPAARRAGPAWKFVHPDGLDGHMQEHLGEIRSWLARG